VRAVRLPSETYYVSVDKMVLGASMGRIEEQFRDLLENGAQDSGLPEGCYAAGQYLNPINQRGIYGTSAALLALARSAASADRIAYMDGIVRYLKERTDIEYSLVDSEDDRAALAGRLAVEWKTAFKCADLLYALAAAPVAVTGRESLTREVLSRIRAARRPRGGWAADLDPQGEIDSLATASIVRALHVAGIPNEAADLEIVRACLRDTLGVPIYEQVFCLLVLLETDGPDEELRALWKRFLERLGPELRARSEWEHQFTLGNHYHYVRVPWQLYLVSCGALISPLCVLFSQHVRRLLMGAIAALNSPEGYVYLTAGHMKSTRTYSILMDTLWRIDRTLAASSYMEPFTAVANTAVRVLYSRTLNWLTFLGACALGGLSLWDWIFDQKAFLSSAGGEFFAAGLLTLLGFTSRRFRKR
jgi:hypothetical protein